MSKGDGMKAYCIDHFGSVDGVVLQSRADPQPGRREILVRVRATSLNYRDLMVLKGGGRGRTKVGVVPLSDGAGEVVAARRRRDAVRGWRSGHRLFSPALVWRPD
jgi:NADPH:quinone reductase-like Zn-dependent oxidoreductase